MVKRSIHLIVCGTFLLLASALQAKTEDSDDYQKGLTAYNLGDFQQALQYFKKAIDDDPDSWAAYQEEGYCYFHLGQEDKMKITFFESLRLHPENAELNAFITSLPRKLKSTSRSTEDFEPSPTPSPVLGKNEKIRKRAFLSPTPTPGFDLTNSNLSERWGSSSWLKVTSGLGFGALGDLANGANVWNQEIIQAKAQGSASFSNFGFRLALESGVSLDKMNSFSAQVDFETGHGFQSSLAYSSPVTQNINPQLFTFGFNFYHYFPADNGRFFLMGGIFFGEALVDFYSDDPIETISGVLTGNSVGFNFGIGNEWKISPTTGFELSGRFRTLTISQVRNNYLVTSFSNTGQVVLAADANGNLGVADSRSIGQGGIRYATLDYTGFNFNCAFVFHLF